MSRKVLKLVKYNIQYSSLILIVSYVKCLAPSSLCDLLDFFHLFSGPAGTSDHYLQWSDLLNMWSSAHFSCDVISVMALTLNRLKLYVSVSVWVRLGREGACRGPRWVPPSPDVWMAFVMRSFCSCVFSLLLCVLYPTNNELSVSLWHLTGERRKCLTLATASQHSIIRCILNRILCTILLSSVLTLKIPKRKKCTLNTQMMHLNKEKHKCEMLDASCTKYIITKQSYVIHALHGCVHSNALATPQQSQHPVLTGKHIILFMK